MPEIIEPPIYIRDGETRAREIYSEDGNKKYRYLLELIWDDELPVLMFVMSHAARAILEHNNGDSAVSKCEDRARNHHLVTDNHIDFRGMAFGGVRVTNIFAFMQTEQNPLLGEANPVHTENHDIIEEYARRQNTVVVCAWGSKCNHRLFLGQAEIIKTKLREAGVPLNYFRLTQARQQPKHVSRLPDECNFEPWLI